MRREQEAVAEIRRLRDGLFDLELHTSADGSMADRALNQSIRALLRLPERPFVRAVALTSRTEESGQ